MGAVVHGPYLKLEGYQDAYFIYAGPGLQFLSLFVYKAIPGTAQIPGCHSLKSSDVSRENTGLTLTDLHLVLDLNRVILHCCICSLMPSNRHFLHDAFLKFFFDLVVQST